MNVDYTLNVRDTYITFADACLKVSMTLGLLGAAVTRLHDLKPNLWPSWLPHWRLKPNDYGSLFKSLQTPSNSSDVLFTGSRSGP